MSEMEKRDSDGVLALFGGKAAAREGLTATNDEDQQTALHLATNTEMVNMLLVNKSRGATFDVGAVSRG